jgi:hypothetical protein
VRRWEAKDLWIQERVRSHELVVTKIAGSTNRADLLTKFLEPARHHELLKLLPLSMPGTRRDGMAVAAAVTIAMMMSTAAATTTEIEERVQAEGPPWAVLWFAVAATLAMKLWCCPPRAEKIVQTVQVTTTAATPSEATSSREAPAEGRATRPTAGRRSSSSDADAVYFTMGGRCYHRADCDTLRNSEVVLHKDRCKKCMPKPTAQASRG